MSIAVAAIFTTFFSGSGRQFHASESQPHCIPHGEAAGWNNSPSSTYLYCITFLLLMSLFFHILVYFQSLCTSLPLGGSLRRAPSSQGATIVVQSTPMRRTSFLAVSPVCVSGRLVFSCVLLPVRSLGLFCILADLSKERRLS